MGRSPKIVNCEDCGVAIWRKANRAIAQLCLSCGVKRGLTAMQQMHDHSGPYYERWLEATGRGKTAKHSAGGK